MPFNAVHAPHEVPEKYKEPYGQFQGDRRTYAGMLAALDEMVGKIVSAVDETGRRSNTLFIFSSDNGGPRPGVITSNGPLRAGKGTLYEGGVHTCAFVAWDGHIKPGISVPAVAHMVDWYPTLLKLTGVSLKQGLPLDGRDIWPCITDGKPSPHEELLLNAGPNAGAIRVGDWKLVINGQNPDSEEEGGAKAAKKAGKGKGKQRGAGEQQVELFNLVDDLSEKKNLAAEMPEKVKSLRARYDFYAKQAVPPKNQAGSDEKAPAK